MIQVSYAPSAGPLTQTPLADGFSLAGGITPRTLTVIGGDAVITQGTVVASTPVLNLVQTWNNAGVTFTGLKLNVTDSASAALSQFVDLQVGSSSRIQLLKSGGIRSLGVSTSEIANSVRLTTDANARVGYGLNPIDAGYLFFGAGGASAIDTFLTRDAANVLAQRNGTAAQGFRVYHTFTDASNYERGVFDWTTTANTLVIGVQVAGTGAITRSVSIRTGTTGLIDFVHATTVRWRMDSNGHWIAVTDNAYDIGASGGSRPRSIYAGTSLVTPKLSMLSTGGAAAAGEATLVAGSVTVNTTAVLTATKVMLTRKTTGGTIGTAITYTIVNATSFTINSDNPLDTSTFSWFLVSVY